MIRRILPAAALLASCQPQYASCNDTYRATANDVCATVRDLSDIYNTSPIYGDLINPDSAYQIMLRVADRWPADSIITFEEMRGLMIGVERDVERRRPKVPTPFRQQT